MTFLHIHKRELLGEKLMADVHTHTHMHKHAQLIVTRASLDCSRLKQHDKSSLFNTRH